MLHTATEDCEVIDDSQSFTSLTRQASVTEVENTWSTHDVRTKVLVPARRAVVRYRVVCDEMVQGGCFPAAEFTPLGGHGSAVSSGPAQKCTARVLVSWDALMPTLPLGGRGG